MSVELIVAGFVGGIVAGVLTLLTDHLFERFDRRYPWARSDESDPFRIKGDGR